MIDRTPREAGATKPSQESRDPAGENATGGPVTDKGPDGGDESATNDGHGFNSNPVPEPGASVEADGGGFGVAEGRFSGRHFPDRRLLTRRAVAGGVALAAGGLLFGLWRRPERAGGDGGLVPLNTPKPSASKAPAPLQEMASLPPETRGVTEAATPQPEPQLRPSPEPLGAAGRPTDRPQIAIVIDDVGLRPKESRQAVGLAAPLTLAFLPYGAASAALAEQARANGHEVIVHLPMDPGGRADPGPQALRLGLGEAELLKRLGWNLSRVPGHVGVNNHMGSAMTENAAAMALVLDRLKRDGGYFLDSRTTANSAARGIAAQIGLPYAERDVFLDNNLTPAAIEKQLAETEALARRYGTAIAIGHPHPQTLAVLDAWLKQAAAKGFDVVPVSAIIATRGSPLWRLARDGKGPERS